MDGFGAEGVVKGRGEGLRDDQAVAQRAVGDAGKDEEEGQGGGGGAEQVVARQGGLLPAGDEDGGAEADPGGKEADGKEEEGRNGGLGAVGGVAPQGGPAEHDSKEPAEDKEPVEERLPQVAAQGGTGGGSGPQEAMGGTAADAPVEVVPFGLQLPQGVTAVGGMSGMGDACVHSI